MKKPAIPEGPQVLLNGVFVTLDITLKSSERNANT